MPKDGQRWASRALTQLPRRVVKITILFNFPETGESLKTSIISIRSKKVPSQERHVHYLFMLHGVVMTIKHSQMNSYTYMQNRDLINVLFKKLENIPPSRGSILLLQPDL